jgi:hypothetical protein
MSRPRSLVLAAGLTFVSCAQPTSSSAPTTVSPTSRTTLESQSPVDWGNPIRGIEVDSLTTAQQSTPFTILEPSGLGTPSAVVVSDADRVPLDGRAVVLIYDTQRFGRVDVLESYADVPPEHWLETMESMVADNDPSRWTGTASLVRLPDGTPCFLTIASNGEPSQIDWLEASIQASVAGPQLSGTEATDLAAALHAEWSQSG